MQEEILEKVIASWNNKVMEGPKGAGVNVLNRPCCEESGEEAGTCS